MSEEWDAVTKIGKSVRSGGGQRATVARTQSEINAARRAGAVVATDKKVCSFSLPRHPFQLRRPICRLERPAWKIMPFETLLTARLRTVRDRKPEASNRRTTSHKGRP